VSPSMAARSAHVLASVVARSIPAVRRPYDHVDAHDAKVCLDEPLAEELGQANEEEIDANGCANAREGQAGAARHGTA
jgi:hypothetical protein